MTPSIQAFIDESQAICSAATDGPWLRRTDLGPPWQLDIYAGTPNASLTDPNGFKNDKDAAFAAHARTALPQALKYLRELSDERDLLKVHNRELRELALDRDRLAARVAELEAAELEWKIAKNQMLND